MTSAHLTLSRVIKKESTYGDHRKTPGTGRSSQPTSSPGSPHAGAAWHPHAHRLAGLVFVGFAAGNVPPFFHYLMPIVIGILLLLRRYQAPTVKQKDAEPTVAAACGE
jgi:hypothetical protein